MAITYTGIPKYEGVTHYENCVLHRYEINGYHDSDFYAIVWDEASNELKTIEYDSTRGGGRGYAVIDITAENLRKVYRAYRNSTVKWVDSQNIEIAKTPQKGKEVKVIRGRKVAKGTTGIVFWIGEKYNPFSGKSEIRAGIKANDGQKHFLLAEYLEVVNYEQYIVHGKKRKEVIKKALMQNIPSHLVQLLNPKNGLNQIIM